MEGGAHVVIEAVRSGTPVLASRIDGNVGLLGADYRGYFAPGDAAGAGEPCCSALPRRSRLCCRRCARNARVRAPLFEPARERADAAAAAD